MLSYKTWSIAMLALLVAVACPVWAQPPNCAPCAPAQIFVGGLQSDYAQPGCYIYIEYELRVCAERTEFYIRSITTSTACCNPAFANATAAQMLAWARAKILGQTGLPPAPLIRVVHPGCWTKNNTTGVMTPCDDNHCCYQDMVPGNPPGPLQTIGVVPVPPCADPGCTYVCAP